MAGRHMMGLSRGGGDADAQGIKSVCVSYLPVC